LRYIGFAAQSKGDIAGPCGIHLTTKIVIGALRNAEPAFIAVAQGSFSGIQRAETVSGYLIKASCTGRQTGSTGNFRMADVTLITIIVGGAHCRIIRGNALTVTTAGVGCILNLAECVFHATGCADIAQLFLANKPGGQCVTEAIVNAPLITNTAIRSTGTCTHIGMTGFRQRALVAFGA